MVQQPEELFLLLQIWSLCENKYKRKLWAHIVEQVLLRIFTVDCSPRYDVSQHTPFVSLVKSERV